MPIYILRAISKIHLTLNYGVSPSTGLPVESYIHKRWGVSLFKMLTHSDICCDFSSARAWSLNVICNFETTFRRSDMLMYIILGITIVYVAAVIIIYQKSPRDRLRG